MNTPNRREFLGATAAAGVAALTATSGRAATRTAKPTADSVIFINMIGGPSQLDTFDPKPDAPSGVRGPFRPIETNVPGIRISELFPEMAKVADKFALVRSIYHDGPPVHEAGLQLVNTGRLFRDGPEWPSLGAMVTHLKPAAEYDPFDWVMMPYDQIDCGIRVGVGLGESGALTSPCHYSWDEGAHFDFWEVCEMAARHIHRSTKFVTVNQFQTVFDKPSWDCHADGGSLACDLNDYRNTVAPSFDRTFSYLIRALSLNGLLERTLVVATGEFGRTPKLNSNGGRDHWPGCWTTIFAGGGVRGGQVIGSSDEFAGEPKDRPAHARDIPATVFHALGIGGDATMTGPDGKPAKVYEGKPIVELF